MPLTPRKTLLIAASALAMTVGTAATSFAAPGDVPAGPQTDATGKSLPLREEVLFNLIDKNADGKIDADEAAAFQKAIFDAVDTNHDGTLTRDEFPRFAGMGDRHGPRDGARMHHDGGRNGHGPGNFNRGPGNFGHGPWHDQDQRGMRNNDRPGPGGFGQRPGDMRNGDHAGPRGPGMVPGQMMAPGQSSGQGPQGGPQQRPTFESLDTNHDGVLSPDEFAAGAPPPPNQPQQ